MHAAAAAGQRETFFELLRPALRSLREHARRELRLLEIEGSLPAGLYTPDDLVDEVLSLAWEQFEKRPQRMPLDLWLLSLMHDQVQRWAAEPRPVLLSEPVDAAAPAEEPEEDVWAALLTGEEAPTLEEEIADRHVSVAGDGEPEPPIQGRLLELVGKLPPRQRQLLLLHVLEGYNTAELAMLFNSSERQVQAELQAARRRVRDWLEQGREPPREEARVGRALDQANEEVAQQQPNEAVKHDGDVSA